MAADLDPSDQRMHDRVFPLWVAHSTAMWAAPEGESVFPRLATPWDSAFDDIRAAWDALTAPENLDALEWWAAQGPMNPTAEDATRRALADCRARQPTDEPRR